MAEGKLSINDEIEVNPNQPIGDFFKLPQLCNDPTLNLKMTGPDKWQIIQGTDEGLRKLQELLARRDGEPQDLFPKNE
jgi:hypothetical protein